MVKIPDDESRWRTSSAALAFQPNPESSAIQLKSLINSLKSRNEEAREIASNKVKRIVNDLKKGNAEVYQAAMQEVNQTIFRLVQEEPYELVAGIAAINALLDIVDPTAAQLAQLGNYTRLALRNSDKHTVVAATRALGRLAKKGGVLAAEHIEREARRAIESISDKDSAKDSTALYASVLVIKELSYNVPALFVQYVEKCIRPIWVAVRDHSQVIREAGADALKILIEISATHGDSRSKNNPHWYPYMWEQCKIGLTARDASLNHGALLCVGDVFQSTGPFLFNKYIETTKWVFHLRDSSHTMVRIAVLRSIPVLARYAKTDFKNMFFADVLQYLHAAIKRENREEKVAALSCLNELTKSLGPSAWRAHWEDSLKAIHGVIEKRNKPTSEALVTYAGVVSVCPPQVEPKITQFMSHLFQYQGVTPSLAEALDILSQHFPSLRLTIQNRLLTALLKTLTGQTMAFSLKAPETKSSSVSSSYSSSPQTGNVQSGSQGGFFGPSSPKSPISAPRAIDFDGGGGGGGGEKSVSMGLGSMLTKASGTDLERSLGLSGSVGATFFNNAATQPSSETFDVDPSLQLPVGNTTHRVSGIAASAPVVPSSPSASSSDQPKASDVQLALYILRVFDFSQHDLTSYVRDHMVKFLDSENPSIRKEAVLTCAAVLVPIPFSYTKRVHKKSWGSEAASTRGMRGAVVAEVVLRLMTIAVADPDSSVRYAIHSSLDGRFAHHLATTENLRSLIMSLHDEVFGIRLLATETMSRLVEYNPSHVLPCLRRQLLQTMSIIEHSIDNTTVYEHLRVLAKITVAAPQVVQVYASVITDVLLLRMHDFMADTDVAYSFLDLLTHFAESIQVLLLPYLDKIFPFVIKLLQDRSNVAKLNAALRCLAAIVRYTGYTIKPLEQYPDLQATLFSIVKAEGGDNLHGEAHPASKREAIKVLGTCGALDPFRWQLKVNQRNRASRGLWDASNSILSTMQPRKKRRKGKDGDADWGVLDTGKQRKAKNAKIDLDADGADWFMLDNAELQREKRRPHPVVPNVPNYNEEQNTDPIPPLPTTLNSTPEMLDLKNATYFTVVVLKGLVVMMQDSSLKRFHKSVVQVVTNIFRHSIGQDIDQLMPLVMPAFLNMLRTRGKHEDVATTRYLLGQLCLLVPLMGKLIQEYLPSIHILILTYFYKGPTLGVVLRLIADLSSACSLELKAYLPQILPRMLMILMSESLPDETLALRCLRVIYCLGSDLTDLSHQVIPTLMTLVSSGGTDLPQFYLTLRSVALKILRKIGRLIHLQDHASAIIHPLIRVLVKPENASLRPDIMGLLCLLVVQLGTDFAMFIPIVHKAVTSVHYTHAKYSSLEERLLKSLPLPPASEVDLEPAEEKFLLELLNVPLEECPSLDEENDKGLSKLQVNEKTVVKALYSACDTNIATRDGWVRWLRSFSLELLQQSPLVSLKMVANLASQHQPLARDLFNIAFVSVWDHLSDRAQEQVRLEIERTLKNATLPAEVLSPLLALLEFLDANDASMQIDAQFLSGCAGKTSSLAKTLRWKEIAFQTAPQLATEGLVTIYNQLGHTQSALGLLHLAEKRVEHTNKEVWYERLGKWDLALEALRQERDELLQKTGGDYSKVGSPAMHSSGGLGVGGQTSQRQGSMLSVSGEERADFQSLAEVEIRMMRGLSALGEWRELYDMAKVRWDSVAHEKRLDTDQDEEDEGDSLQHSIAPYCTEAAWRMSDWAFMAEAVDKLPVNTYERYFNKAILSLKARDDETCQWAIDNARDCLAQELTSLVSEGYERCYSCLIQCQQLAELEEIRLARNGTPELKQLLLSSWTTRLRGCANSVHCWRDILQVRTLLLDPVEDCGTWLKFVSLCRNQGQHGLEKKTLLLLLGHEHANNLEPEALLRDAARYNPRVTFAYFKHLWAVGERQNAYHCLNTLVSFLKKRRHRQDHELLSRCCVKLGDWTPEIDPSSSDTAIEFYKSAMQYDRNWYRAWHAWALANQNLAAKSEEASAQQLTHITSAIRGYVKSIMLGPSHASILQDILRLLGLWFIHGGHPSVEQAVKTCIEVVQLDLWLLVIPQIIARVNTTEPRVASLVGQLLSRIGKEYPQSLVYALTVSAKAATGTTYVHLVHQSEGKRDNKTGAASKVLDSMRETSASLVEQCEFVSSELIRVAIIWHELWYEGIEEASKQYFVLKDVEGMLRALFPLHKMMERIETLREASFVQTYGRDLQEAYEWCQSYLRDGDDQHIHQAWELYYSSYKKIKKSLQKDFTFLELPYCSPLLYKARDLDIIVPGLPHSRTAIRIKSFNPRMDVMVSKQRPRRIAIHGSDGTEYRFLLKGHEDLRLDERVMQLFGLVNALFGSDPATAMQTALQIQRYPVIPLNSNAGLIGWVDGCDTLHVLVREFRERKKMRINIEYQHMVQLCFQHESAYEILPLINKVELFEYAMSSTTGQDLYKVLWFQSGTAEVWLERRTTYTLSLATMSMVGYILGLGDRHPNNLMLQRVTGKVVHIDFGDCFEVAAMRDKFPERIPFRLTRMLRNAMEVTSIEGNFRHTCENVMRVLREHKGSVMAMLEAFVHDPLLQWRILRAEQKPDDQAETAAEREKMAKKNAVMRHNMILEYIDDVSDDGDAMPRRKDRRDDERELVAMSTRDETEIIERPQDTHKGVQLLKRIDDKLKGKDFETAEVAALSAEARGRETSPSPLGTSSPLAATFPSVSLSATDEGLPIAQQVSKLIDQATRVENLCNSYIGWCAFW